MNPVVLPILIWVTCAVVIAGYAAHDRREPAAWIWTAGDAAALLALLAFLARAQMPAWASVGLLNLGQVLQPLLHVLALSVLCRRPKHLSLGFGIATAIVAINVASAALDGDRTMRSVVASVGIVAIHLPLLGIFMEKGELRAPLRVVCIALGLILVLLILRTVAISQAPLTTGPVNAPNFTATGVVVTLVYAMLVIVLNMSFLWLLLRRSATRHAEELIGMMEKLSVAKAAAEAASRSKSAFIANMSHELRTPLNAILGFNELLRLSGRDTLTPKQLEWTGYVDQAGRHQLQLVEDLLDLARIESGRLSVETTDVPLAAAVQAALNDLAATAEARDIAIDTDVGNWVVKADAARLRQIVANLLSNAIKYNRNGGTVRITGRGDGAGRVRIAVDDTGNGVPHDRIDELFRPFSRLGAEATSIEGTGIGLSLVRNLAEAMNGTVGYSPATSGGSRFWVELPAADAVVRGAVAR